MQKIFIFPCPANLLSEELLKYFSSHDDNCTNDSCDTISVRSVNTESCLASGWSHESYLTCIQVSSLYGFYKIDFGNVKVYLDFNINFYLLRYFQKNVLYEEEDIASTYFKEAYPDGLIHICLFSVSYMFISFVFAGEINGTQLEYNFILSQEQIIRSLLFS